MKSTFSHACQLSSLQEKNYSAPGVDSDFFNKTSFVDSKVPAFVCLNLKKHSQQKIF